MIQAVKKLISTLQRLGRLSPLLSALLIFSLSSASFVSVAGARNNNQKYISLTAGLTYDHKMADIPVNLRTVGDFRKITRVQVDRKRNIIRFIPKKVGVGTLTLLDSQGRKVADFRIDVKRSNLNKAVREMRALLGDIEGIHIKVVNNKIVVDGQILLPKDLNRIYSVIRQYEGLASTLVTLSPVAQKKIAKVIERDINNPEIHVRAVNDKFILEGMASGEDEKKRAEIIAKTYAPDIVVEAAEADGLIKKRKVDTVINLIAVKAAPEPEPGKIIQLVVHYVELQKDYTKGFRFQWTPSLGDGSSMNFRTGDRGPAGIITTITGTISNLLPKLNWAKEHGHARVLQSSSLIVQDKQKGDLKSVVRIPFQTLDGNGQKITNFEQAGMVTNITPNILGSRSDSIRLDMNFSVKSLLSMSDQGPLISDNNIKTVIVVRSGKSAAVGGLISNSSGTNYNKLPPNVSRNPIISLYASKDFRRNQSQFVVFVTPIIKSSASEGSEKIKRKFRLRD